MTDTMPTPADEGPQDTLSPQWWTIAQAARAVAVHDRTIRRALKAGEVKGQREPHNPTAPWFVSSTDVLRRFGPKGQTVFPPPAEPAEPTRAMIPLEVFAQLQGAYLQAQESRAAAEVDARTAQHDLGRVQDELTRVRAEADQLRARIGQVEPLLGWAGRRRLRRLQADR